MSKRPKAPSDASRRYHDRVARQYDSIYEDPYWEFHDELTWRLIKPHLPGDANARCADLGCGTGKWGLRLLKSGFATTFVDHSATMIGQTRQKLESMGTRATRATLLTADIVDLREIPSESMALVVAMGDPLSICSDPQRAAREMARILQPGGWVVATADNLLAGFDHFTSKGRLDELEDFARSGKTNWLTADENERFELTMFTPTTLAKLFEKAGLVVDRVVGKPVLPVRQAELLLRREHAVERLLRLEMEISRDPAAAARASHLQISARRPRPPAQPD